MKLGDLVRHKCALDWGVGVVVEEAGNDNKCKINFEDRGQVILALSVAENMLEPVDLVEIAVDSPLLDHARWACLELAPDQRPKHLNGADFAPKCEHCQKPLNQGQYSSDRRWKSCPRCSAKDRLQHVFFPRPDGFGVSAERVTENNPAGDQSYCYSCRKQEQPATAARCSTIAQ